MNHPIRRPILATLVLATAGAFLLPMADADAKRGKKQSEEFERISTFYVCENTSCDRDVVEETVAEITDVTQDGKTLIYTDSPQELIGFVDIKDPYAPAALGTASVGGEPTSVAVAGKYVLVGVNTSESFTNPSGHLAVFDINECLKSISGCAPVAELDMGGQPDAVAVSPNRQYAAVAIENERDEDITVDGVEGGLPQLPAGFLVIVDIKGKPADWGVRVVDLTGLSAYAPEDPEPEFVAINDDNIAAVTLQENNHIILVDLKKGKVKKDFPAGTVKLENIDTVENRIIEFNTTKADIPREPDAITWLNKGKDVATANEGDLFGGSRGFTIFDSKGKIKFDTDTDYEYLSKRVAHFPEERAENKGSEPEAITAAKFGKDEYLFVGSERGSFVAVYEVKGKEPKLKQVLPTGIAPEGLLAIPQRDLFIASTEDDDEWRTQINIFKLQRGPASYPHIVSDDRASSKTPIPWGALSGMDADPSDKNTVYVVPDSFYKQSRIYTMNVKDEPAVIEYELVLMKDGNTVDYDLEGIALRTGGGYWLASEGRITNPAPRDRNLLIKVAADGSVLEEIRLPADVEALQIRFGFEGVAVTGSGDGEKVYVAFQREWMSDPAQRVRIGEYTPLTDEWRFFYYPLDAVESPNGGWVGLSELTSLGNDRFAVIERDNQGGPNARVKRIYVFSIAGVTPIAQGGTFPVLTKYLKQDVLPDLQSFNGWVLDKLEGLAITTDGEAYAVTDNDGVDDHSGETRLLRLGKNLH